MPKYAVEYSYIEDVPRRHAVRPEHRDYLRALAEQGKVLAAGAWTADDGGLLVFEVDDEAEMQKVLDNDPYKAAEVIASTKVTAWTPVLGVWLD
ncbi:YciI family protein [Kutzneria sp. 744]|uniref:YciI family protein n=1 Tax=Kutzneria sp. (strain 744) TaxID=345341 RepID=UPI0003EEC2BC|nr:YciI family protein [Kutzneria sp. 744]EWM15067.1 YCII family protein [Kutzneria sp. 744]